MCQDAARLLSGSVGWYASQLERRAAYWMPPSKITLVAPVPRTASTSSCIPAAWKLMPLQVPPSRQQRQASGVSELLSGNGSLNRSKITRLLPLKATATWRQNSGVCSRFGIGAWPSAMAVPAALQCRSRMTTSPAPLRRATKSVIARRELSPAYADATPFVPGQQGSLNGHRTNFAVPESHVLTAAETHRPSE